MAELTDEQIELVETKVFNTLRHRLVTPTIFSTLGVGPGVKKYTWNDESEMGAASMVSEGAAFPIGSTELTPESIDLWTGGKAFRTTYQSLWASMRNGIPLDDRWAAQAARRLAELIDDTILLGNTTFGIDGLENVAGSNTVAAAATWDAGGAEPYNDVNDAIVELEEDDVDTSDLVLIAPRNFAGHLRRRTAQQEVIIRAQIGDIIGGEDNIFTSSRITQTQALLVARSEENMRIIESVAPRTTGPIDEPQTKSFYWDVYAILGFAIYQPTGICKITGVGV